MAVSTYTMADYTSTIAPARFFRAFCLDTNNFMPKALPDFVKSVELIEGDDSTSVGSVSLVNFPEGRPFKFAKNRVDEIDAAKFYKKYTTIEGDILRDILEYAVYEIKFEPSGEGSRYTMVAHFHTKGDYMVKEEEVASGKESIKKTFNSAEQYLAANPELYA